MDSSQSTTESPGWLSCCLLSGLVMPVSQKPDAEVVTEIVDKPQERIPFPDAVDAEVTTKIVDKPLEHTPFPDAVDMEVAIKISDKPLERAHPGTNARRLPHSPNTEVRASHQGLVQSALQLHGNDESPMNPTCTTSWLPSQQGGHLLSGFAAVPQIPPIEGTSHVGEHLDKPLRFADRARTTASVPLRETKSVHRLCLAPARDGPMADSVGRSRCPRLCYLPIPR